MTIKEEIVQISFRLPRSLLKDLTKLAKLDKNRRRNDYMLNALIEHVSEQKRIRDIQDRDRTNDRNL